MRKAYGLFLLMIMIQAGSFARQDPGAVPDSMATQQQEAVPQLKADSASAAIRNKAENLIESPTSQNPQVDSWRDHIDWKINLAGLVALLSLLFAIWEYRRRLEKERELAKMRLELQKQHETGMTGVYAEHEAQKEQARLRAREETAQEHRLRAAKTAEQEYTEILRKELGFIQLLGHQELKNVPINLEDAFVSLRISREWRAEERFRERERKEPDEAPDELAMLEMTRETRDLAPLELLRQAFAGDNRLLLIVGDPGSGKTTVMKYYALSCLDGQRRNGLGLGKNLLPLYLPLKELTLPGDSAGELLDQIAAWGGAHNEQITPEVLRDWISRRPTLILLDGLDEIPEQTLRQRTLRVIEKLVKGQRHARVVVTSRWAAYGKGLNVYFKHPHLRADIRDFSPEQQGAFLENWFFALEKVTKYPGRTLSESEEAGLRRAATEAAAPVVRFLEKPDHEVIQKLVENPLMLQILAYLWQERRYRPRTRPALYRAAMSYILSDRELEKELEVPVSGEVVLGVLKPVALRMQEQLRQDFIAREKLTGYLADELYHISDAPSAETLVAYLHDRAGLFNDYRQGTCYIFRHKSFMEFLAAQQLKEVCHQPGRMEQLAEVVFDPWWNETLRFFMSDANQEIFREFMEAVLRKIKREKLSGPEKQRVLQLIQDATHTGVSAFKEALSDAEAEDTQYLLIDCLRTVNTLPAYQVLKDFAEGNDAAPEVIRRAVSAIKESKYAGEIEISDSLGRLLRVVGGDNYFRNLPEYNAEYIRIPGGTFRYSVSGKDETVPELFFAKYPVTNRRYRRFINYLAGKDAELEQQFPRANFGELLLAFAATVPVSRAPYGEPNYRKFLGEDITQWAKRLTNQEDDKRFLGDEQPVVGVSWYAARAYCLWLSALQLGAQGVSVESAAKLYRLPTELEWEWAAAGRGKDGVLREYPWGNKKPDKERANYENMIGATTPVGQYPAGATPEGLLDMAGNVWEWMENWYDKDQDFRSLRGGSWGSSAGYLRCSARLGYQPDFAFSGRGFRVVCAQSDKK